jgi:hypothetical protein
MFEEYMISTKARPTFLAEQKGPYSYCYRARNEAAYRICRLANSSALTDEQMKLVGLLGIDCEIKRNENDTLSETP